MDPALAGAAATELLDMRARHRIEPDLPEHLRPATLEAAYAIQREVVAGLLPPGTCTIGYKVACTSEVAQQALQIDGPLFGRLLSHTSHQSGVVLDAARFVHRVIEAEFAFRIGADVPAHSDGWSIDSIASYIDAVIPAIEIVDYRYQSWTVGALQVAADNAIHGAWVHGDSITGVDLSRLDAVGVEVTRNGVVVTTGSGQAVLGHPLAVMAWLAGELPRFGSSLRAGDLVTTGVTTGVFEAEAGDTIEARFDALGDVRVDFA
jgi:2-keto-4-pentenoate hydratase